MKNKRRKIDTGNLDMTKNSVRAIKHHADELSSELKKNPEIEAWVLAKTDRAAQNLSDVTHYLDGEMNKYALGGRMAKVVGGPDELLRYVNNTIKDRSERDSIRIAKEYQKVIDSRFDKKVYENYEKLVKETEIPKEDLQKIEHYVNTTPKEKRRDIDIYRYWALNDLSKGWEGKSMPIDDKRDMIKRFPKFADGGMMGRYTVNVYYGGEMEDEVFYTDNLFEAKKISQQGEHSEIYDNVKKVFIEEEYADGGMIQDFEIYDEQTGKSLFIKARSLDEAEGISETIDFDDYENGDIVDVLDDIDSYQEYAKGGIVTKSKVISELQKLGFGKEKAENLLEKHIDIYEINEDDEDAKTIALQIEEQYNQEYAKGGSILDLKDVYNELRSRIGRLEINEETSNYIYCDIRDWGNWEHDYEDYDRDEEDFEDDDAMILSRESSMRMSNIVKEVRAKYPSASISWNTSEKNYIDFQISRKMAKGGKVKERVYIDYLNKAKGFQKDRKYFDSYEDAVKWARSNFDKFDTDYIKYEY
jgi:hypothetical protein